MTKEKVLTGADAPTKVAPFFNCSGYSGPVANGLDTTNRKHCFTDIFWNVEHISDCTGGLAEELTNALARLLEYNSKHNYYSLDIGETVKKFGECIKALHDAHLHVYGLRCDLHDAKV